MNTVEVLKQLFKDNFVAYFRAHIAHINVTGRNFLSDHELFQKIYTDLYTQVDDIGELIRTLQDFAPCDLENLCKESGVPCTELYGDSEHYLNEVMNDLYVLKSVFEELLKASKEEDLDQVTGYAEDQLVMIAKHIWQLESTLG